VLEGPAFRGEPTEADLDKLGGEGEGIVRRLDSHQGDQGFQVGAVANERRSKRAQTSRNGGGRRDALGRCTVSWPRARLIAIRGPTSTTVATLRGSRAARSNSPNAKDYRVILEPAA
jgi:hypothetical protein